MKTSTMSVALLLLALLTAGVVVLVLTKILPILGVAL
jgi:hypothetical protein